MGDAAARVTQLYRYPVKGLTPERMAEVLLRPGETVPGDRMWAIENGPAGGFDAEAPRHLPKIHFLMLMRNERLAALSTHYDDAATTLTISRNGKQVARGDLSTKIGRSMIEQFMAAYMKAELRGAPRVVSAAGHSFSDVAAKCVHIVNLASLREVERVMGRPLDPVRFRPNIVVDGLEPWVENGWIGREIVIGPVRLAVTKRTKRCDATNVDPATAARDTDIPAALLRTWGHSDFGVYATVSSPGVVAEGAEVALRS